MVKVCLDRLHNLFPHASLLMITQSPEILKQLSESAIPTNVFLSRKIWAQKRNVFGKLFRLIPSYLDNYLAELENIIRFKYPDIMTKWICYRSDKRENNSSLAKQYLKTIDGTSIVIASGGGFLTDAFEAHAIEILELLYLAQIRGKRTAMFGQGVGPATSPKLLKAMKKVLPELDLITLREGTFGLKFLLDLGVKRDRIVVTGDDALELAKSGRCSALGKNIGFNIRVAEYATVNSSQDILVAQLLKRYAAQKQTEIISVPISWYPNEHDLNQISNLLEVESEVHPFNAYDIEKLCDQISKCRIVVTGSYHAGVFALAQGIPVIGLARSKYYIHKFKGLSDMFPSGVSVICFEDMDWETQLDTALENAWISGENIRNHLISLADDQIELSKEAYKKFFSYEVLNKPLT